MGRYTGPLCRRCRAEGMKLFLKGIRCSMAKCPIETERPAPGVHGQQRRKKLSDYGRQLREKQRLRNQFGMRENQFRLFFQRALRGRTVTGDVLLQLLETRLDNLVYRLGFAVSRAAARQFVTHSHVTVNGRRAAVPSMTLKAGSVIEVRNRPKSREQAKKALEAVTGKEMPSWLKLDANNFSGELVRIPTRDEISPVVNEQLIVELYSK
ncbi:MAG: 30S ribosomal protein S4 [Kiritimatiellae bacterium]|nr:30S ribosomal protein S4 [Kiritimatiellia bacterium]MDD5522253.1 30S ribosomal protein S4 [Kiritimatiellia bacterium]